MDTIPEGFDLPRNGPPGDGELVSDPGILADARNKLAVALGAFAAAQSTVPGLQAALVAGRPLPRDDLFVFERVRVALADAAQALGVDPDQATLAELEARLSTWERILPLRSALEPPARGAGATGRPAAPAALAVVTADAARLATAAAWSPGDEVHVRALSLLVE